MRTSLLILTLLIGAATPEILLAQTGSLYGGSGNQYGYRVKSTRDGGFIVAGGTDAKGAGSTDYWVMRFDNHAQPLWDSAYGRVVYDNLWSIEPTSDNGALIAGFSGIQNSGTEEALMYKIDSVGRVVKKIEVDYSLADHAHWFKQMNDGNYYWAGHTDSKGDPQGDMILQKLDKSFNLVWEKTYDFGSSEHCHAGAIAHDNGCMLIGHTTINSREKFYAVRTDTLGKVMWQKSYSSDPNVHDSPYDVLATIEGNFAFFGGSQFDSSTMWLLVVDSIGNPVIDKHFAIGQSFCWSGVQTSDSGFALIGVSQKNGGNQKMYIVKTDKKGNRQWEKTYGNGAGDEALSIIQHGNQYVAVGDGLDNQGNADLWVIVMDSVGNLTTFDTSHASVNSRSYSYENGTRLDQNFPNPSNTSTTIGFTLTNNDRVAINILSADGALVFKAYERSAEVGQHYINVNTTNLASGTYYYQLKTSATTITRPMMVVR